MLKFRRLDVIIAEPGFARERPGRIIILWELVTQHSGLDKVTFDVERSLSPQFKADDESETKTAVDGIEGIPGQLVYEHVDLVPNLIGFWRNYFYRVRANTPDGPVYSEARHWETNPRPHELAIIERHDFLLTYLQGQPTFSFVERTAESARCSCYNPTTSRVEDSQCRLCLGTGRQRPFLSPILHYVDFNPDQKLVDMSFRENEPGSKSCWFSAFPILKPGDVMYQPVKGTLSRIATISTIQPQGTTIQQVAQVTSLDRSEVKYQRLPQMIPQEEILATVRQWELIKEERLF